MKAKGLSTSDVAKLVGIDRTSLQRWIATKRVKAPTPIIRNGRAVRLWFPADIEALKATKARTYRKGRGRKPKTN